MSVPSKFIFNNKIGTIKAFSDATSAKHCQGQETERKTLIEEDWFKKNILLIVQVNNDRPCTAIAV